VATTTLAVSAVACGDDSDGADSAGDDAAVTTEATASGSANSGGGDAVNGEQLARSMGCAGCHGQNFGGGAGPSLVGLAGTDVLLADGTTVLADTAYLTRAIANPSADLVADYNLRMPANGLNDAEIADIVAFIETLADG
jgi:cytochrome c oxidase subunit 2